MKNNSFTLLKRTFPVSTFERECDGYKYLLENTTEEQRKEFGIKTQDLKETIKENEKYIYQVGKENNELKIFVCSFENYSLIRKYVFGIADEI